MFPTLRLMFLALCLASLIGNAIAQPDDPPCCQHSGVIVEWIAGNLATVDMTSPAAFADASGRATIKISGLHAPRAPFAPALHVTQTVSRATAEFPPGTELSFRTYDDQANARGIIPVRDAAARRAGETAPVVVHCALVHVQAATSGSAPMWASQRCRDINRARRQRERTDN